MTMVSSFDAPLTQPLRQDAMRETDVDLSVLVQTLDNGHQRLDLAVEGITCAACMPVIERGLLKIHGVHAARVNLTNRRLVVEFDKDKLPANGILVALKKLGFKAYPYDPRLADTEDAREVRFLLYCLGVAGFATMNVMLLSVSVWSGNVSDIAPEQRDFFHWLSALIAIPAVAFSGRPFFRSALNAIRARQLNMDVPISLGVLLAIGMSIVETANHAHHAYFDSALMLLFFLLTGRYFDRQMRRQTRTAAINVLALKADRATRIQDDGALVEVPIQAIAINDLVLVRPGERVSVDGIVTAGQSRIDQSLVTGETRLDEITVGSPVFAGTMNLGGALQVRVQAAAKGTLIDDVATLLDTATAHRSRYIQLADRAARLYSPVVHLTALLTLVGWILAGLAWQQSLIIAITVLIITCPCALGLAIPAVQVAASAVLFRAGILMHSGDALERLADIDTVVFDKTGTLTLPNPAIVNENELDPELLQLARRLALSSNHPLARALTRDVTDLVACEESVERAGSGVLALVDGRELRLGSAAFCQAEAEAQAVRQHYPEASLIAVSDGTRRGVIAISQSLRTGTRELVGKLVKQGYAVEILSGDGTLQVSSIAEELGITTWQASLKPADKVARLEALKAARHHVLMVGDGLNDAPALASAHVSISPVSATDLAQAHADCVLLGEQLAGVAVALRVAKIARRLMSQNLWLAVVYNFLAVPLAIAGWVTPLVAALAMSGSSIIVTANAARLALLTRKDN